MPYKDPEVYRRKSLDRTRKWRTANPERWKEQRRLAYAKNKDYYARKNLEFREKNPDYLGEWRVRNPGKNRAKSNKYRAAKLRAVPSWADLKVIEMFYADCPKGYVVDHIIPLQGKEVCGLHVRNNLQYLTSLENSVKSNQLLSI